MASHRGGTGTVTDHPAPPLLDNQRAPPTGWIHPKVTCIWLGAGRGGWQGTLLMVTAGTRPKYD